MNLLSLFLSTAALCLLTDKVGLAEAHSVRGSTQPALDGPVTARRALHKMKRAMKKKKMMMYDLVDCDNSTMPYDYNSTMPYDDNSTMPYGDNSTMPYDDYYDHYDEAEQINDELEGLCVLWSLYDRVVRFNRQSAAKTTWMEACDEFDVVDEYLCPDGPTVDVFCAGPLKPHLNPTVRWNYCAPLFTGLLNDTRRFQCVDYCVNYVSQDRGSCCDWTCPPPNTMATNATMMSPP